MDKHIYYEQIHAKRLKSLILFPQENFIVCEEYLCGIEKEAFYSAYNELLQVFLCLYGDMEREPEKFGLPLFRIEDYSSNSSEGRKSKIYFYPMLLFGAFSTGKLLGSKLIIDANLFMEEIKKYRITYANRIMQIFSAYGFVFTIDGKNMCLEYKSNSDVLKVLAAATDKAKRMGEVVSNTKYMCFYYKLFAECSSSCEEYDISHYCKVLPAYAKTINKLNEDLLKLDFFSSPNGFYRLNFKHYIKNKYNDIIYLSYTEDCDVYIRLKLKHIKLYEHEIDTLPVHIKESLKKYLCRYCSESCSRNNIKFTMEGKALEACVYNSFVFYHPSMEDIKFYISLISWEMKFL